MSAAAEEKRNSTASKLKDSIRQLRRYLDGDSFSERVLLQKCEKVDRDREELISNHHLYAKRAGLDLEDAENRAFLDNRIDSAVDIVDEATVLAEKLSKETLKEAEDVSGALDVQKRGIELVSVKLETQTNEILLQNAVEMINPFLQRDEHAEDDVKAIEMLLEEVQIREEELIKSWNLMKSLLTTEEKMTELTEAIIKTKTLVMQVRTDGRLIVSKGKVKMDNTVVETTLPPNNSKIMYLQKMKPPTFSGNIREFARFRADFQSIVMPSYDDSVHQVYVLKETCLKGEAYDLVRNLEELDDIWERLEERFGDTIDIVDSVIQDMQNIVIPKFNQDQGVINLIEVLERGVQDLTSINKRKEIANAYTIRLIEKKLPRRIMLQWLEEGEKGVNEDRFETLLEFLKKERKKIERILQQSKEKEEIPKKRHPVGHVRDGERREKSKDGCLLHSKSGHFTRKCKDFLSKTVDERAQLLNDLGACKFCLSLSHVGKRCPWEGIWNPCGIGDCKELHSRLVHGSSILKSFPVHHFKKYEDKCNVSEAQTLLLMQNVESVNGGQLAVFWDNGSTISLVSKDYARENKLRGVNVSYELVTVGNVVRPQTTCLYDVPITDHQGSTVVIKAYEINEICQNVEAIDVKKVTQLFHGLKPREIERPKGKVDLLVGMNYAHLHPIAKGTNEGLVLFHTMYGSGKVLGGQHRLISGTDKLSAFTKLVAHATFRNVEVDRRRIDFFTAENLGVNVPPRCHRCKNCRECKFETHQLSMIEQKELTVIRDNLKLDPINNVWRTVYPYKCDPSILSNNRGQAVSLLVKLENRLMKNKIASDKYCEQFDDFVKRGIFKEISETEMKKYDGPVSYISHHEVFKEESVSTPIRIVLNSSLKFKGISLNDILMKGPNSLNDIFSVQLRFRTHRCALVADVTKMYHSIKTTEKERHLRRVLWRSMKIENEPKTYGSETVAFGDRPAAAISAVAIQETAKLFQHIDEKAAEKIKEDMYVDDLATGDINQTKVEALKKGVTEILSHGGFVMKGFVMSGDDSEEVLSLLGSGEFGRVLGVGWDPKFDEFAVKVRINLSRKFKGARQSADLQGDEIPLLLNEKLSRRVLLSITNSCYDPFGLLSPITIQLKMELRELYRKDLNLDWDDDIMPEMKVVWVGILSLLKEAETLRFRRCIGDINSKGDPELVIFCDGAPGAMCTAAYIRWELGTGKFSTQLVAAKARVTPLDRVTIPRIEMQSAVMGARLGKSIMNSCNLNFKNVNYISDSECTLATLAKDSTALKEFMGNRVAEITNLSDVSQWYHVRSPDNIADIATRRGATIDDIKKGSAWQTGPSWLRLPRSQWPITQDINLATVPNEELNRGKVFNAVVRKNLVFDVQRVMSKSYSFLMRLTARVLTVFQRKSFRSNEISPESLEKAENYWIKESMVLTTIELEKGNLDSLRPKIDENGFIVLSTRAIKGMKLNYDNETFPILTSKDPFARLWIKEVHEEDHSGITKTVAKSRRKYWVIRARRIAQNVKSSCYRCRLLDKKLAAQQMCPLTDSRLSIAPVFNVTSIDLFGPIMIKDAVKKRVKMKVWGFIATCAATRALHLDVADSYSTDSILQTIRKFTSIRGCPSEIISDQGSQLIAASKDVTEMTKDWDWTVVSMWAGDNKIKWTVVPAEGQHQNGLSESLVKSVKRTMMHMIGENVLTFSELQLAFYEITNIINSRPIGVLSGSDPEMPKALTPNDLLLGRCTNAVPQGPFNTKVSITKRFLFIQGMIDDWWKLWYDAVLPSLVPCYKWLQKHRNVKIGDICLIRYKGLRSSYRLGRVIQVKQGADGLVRTARLEYKLPGERVKRFVDRAIHGIAVIVPFEEQELRAGDEQHPL